VASKILVQGARPGHGTTTVAVACRLALVGFGPLEVVEVECDEIRRPRDVLVVVLRGPDVPGIESAARLPTPDLLVLVAEPGRAVTPDHAASILQAGALVVVPIDPEVALANDSGLFPRRFDELRVFDELRTWLHDWVKFRSLDEAHR